MTPNLILDAPFEALCHADASLFAARPPLDTNANSAQDVALPAADNTYSSRRRVSLDGEWTFQFGDETPSKIQVPGAWESQRPDLHQQAGSAFYERSFLVSADARGQRVVLRFGAVDYYTEVWVNGLLVGTHEGGYTAFEFDITPALRGFGPDAVQNLMVRVTDATVEQDAVLPDGQTLTFAEIPHGKQSWYTSVSGIWQSVWLESRPLVSIARIGFTPDVDAGRAHLTLGIAGLPAHAESGWFARVHIETPEGADEIAPFVMPLTGKTYAGRGEQETDGDTVSVQEAAPGVEVFTTSFDVPNAQLWSPQSPCLYTAHVTLEYAGRTVDTQSKRWGMRKVEAREGRVYLNNLPIFIAGALDQDFYPRTIYTAPSKEYLRDELHKAKEMGLNLMRFHIKIPTEEYLDLCDELGLLVWYELPNGARLSSAFRERALHTLQSMWERDCSHPCIIILTIMNESWGIDLNSGEQRKWLANTYRWAKRQFPSWLIVDNSACIPNFHVVSDLDDYHVYYNIPDQAKDFAEWMATFAGREAGTFTGYGDAEYGRSEPLLISEFGNWGLPRVDKIIEAEGGEPYWFKTGDGATRPHGVLKRFAKQRLDRVFADYNALAASSQEQQWLSLKYEIEEMRRYPHVAGYVITEFTDINWECNGLLDMARNPKVFHDRLKDLQAQDILIPRLGTRASFWSGDTALLGLEFSCFSGQSVAGGTIDWNIAGLPGLGGRQPVQLAAALEHEPTFGTYGVAQIAITAPPVVAPSKHVIELRLCDAQGNEVARASQNIVFAPANRRDLGQGRRLWLHDPQESAIGLSSLLADVGFDIVTRPQPDALALVTKWDKAVAQFLHTGGKAVLVATQPQSLTIADGLGVHLQERSANGWWGDWCTSKVWFLGEQFPSLPDTSRFDFEYQAVVPSRVMTGPMPENTGAGLFVGWLHNPAALVARLPIGRGDLVVTTFDLLPHIGSDPIATLLLHDLFAMPPADREE